VIPAVGRARKVEAGNSTTSYVWQGVFEVDPADPRIAAVIAKRSAGPRPPDAGDAGAILYAEQVKAAGIATHTLDFSFDYSIQSGKLNVVVRPDDQFHEGDPTGFTVSVGIPGG
jgi:hypothetical protein